MGSDPAQATPAHRDSIAVGLAAWMAEVPDADPQVEALRQRLSGLARLLERGLTQIADRHGFTLGDWDALSALQRSGPPYERSPTQLASATGVTSGTMSVRLNRLVETGLVGRTVSRGDGRGRAIRLTPEGRRRWRRATAERVAVERDLVHRALPGSELGQLNDLLATLLAGFEQELGPPPVRGPFEGDQRTR